MPFVAGRSPIERFIDLVHPEPNSGCWLWVGAVNRDGYGQFHFHGKAKAHRVAWRLYRGEISHGLHVLHKCDVRCCVNPEHLWLGTHVENVRDKERKGRGNQPVGERHPCCRFTERDILKIRSDPRSNVDIAKEYGVHNASISRIRLRQSWGHIA